MSSTKDSPMPRAKDLNLKFTSHMPFNEYSDKYKDHVVMERRDGVIMLRMHTQNKALVWTAASHRAVPHAIRDAAADPENQVLILTATGNFWVAYGAAGDDAVTEVTTEERAANSMNYFVGDGMPLQEYLVNDVRIPTIGAVTGPGYHNEMALMCDLTICTEDTVMIDVHPWFGFVPGDGINVAYQGLMGIKRANYAMLLGEPVTAKQALEWGMVNEVVKREQIYNRAWELGARIMQGGAKRRVFRRMTTEIMRKQWKTRMADDFFGGFAAEMYAYMAEPDVTHNDEVLEQMWKAAGVTIPKW